MPRSTRTTGGRHSEQSREYDTQSLTESVTQYPIENGRTYHKYHEGSYVYPNDEREMNRLDMQHHMCKLLTGGRLFFAPLRNPRQIVDIGTGSGIWAIELASIFPRAQITGTDLSPCQPDEVPENVHFIVDDCTEDEWLWHRNSLDYIHSGHMSGALPSYKDLLRKMFDHLKPGGWAECQEFDTMVKCDDGTMPPLTDALGAYPFQDWCDLQIRAAQSTDPPRQYRVAHRIARGMRDVGFVDVQEYIFKAPVNPWSSDPHLHTIGKWNESNILEALSGWSYKPLKALSWSKPEIEVFLAQVRQSVQDRRVHAYFDFHACAYRHAIRPTTTTTATADHVWINDELLASTFRRFTSGQRRHESRVPGPLEARRRLAKRRNTALASVAGPGILDDVACLFGRNGREHMKWTNGQGRPSVNQFSSPNAPAPLEDFYNETVGPFESGNPFFISPNVWNTNEEVPENRSIEEQLQDCRTVNELKYVVRVLNLDLRREPEYSRLIFDHLMSLFVSHQTSVHELLLFLDDRNLNIPGAGNYLGVVEHYVSRGVQWKEHDPLFDAVIRAFELGLIPAAEIRDIVERLSDINAFRRKTGSFLTKLYRSIWDAIGRCGIYGHRDLDAAIFDSWLGAILQSGTQSDYRLARTILLDAGHGVPDPSLWLQKFISRWLEDSHGLTVHPHNDGDYVAKFLAPFGADLVSQSLISVTKGLVTSGEAQLLKRWAEWLPKVQNVSDIVSSPVWADVGVLHSSTSHQAPMSPRHQILQRLWLLHTIWMGGGVRRAGRHPTIHSLHRLYDMARREGNEDLWNNFIKGIHDLKLPWKDLKSAVYYMRRQVVLETPRSGTSGTALQRFESKPLSFPDIFADPRASQAASHVFFHNMEKMIRRIDITSPAFLENALLIARTGDTSKLWTIVRILRSHTPLKIAISQSWHRPDPADMTLVRHPARPRSPYHPEPHACLEMIHMLATAFATSEQIHPRRAFSLVYWLSGFCYQHGAPIRPKLARSLYHAGIVRFRREGLRISTEQYNWIWDVVERAESPELMRNR
ncbi:hypothetical protein BJX63DRAFT_423629 [Aspergillus granulosus]|uniref:Methyltransferase domain-containing protein n=1 Tax=Aspergillus granulosus TaxID=176169 RepID=A0ABR4H2I3_9EURO